MSAKNASITLAPRSQTPPSPVPAGPCRDEAQNDEDPGQHGKPNRKKAHGDEECDRFRTLDDSAEIIDSLVGKGDRSEAAALGNDGECQEAGGRPHEAKKQGARRQSIGRRIGKREAKWHGGVNKKIKRNVQKGISVCDPGEPGDCPIESVENPVEEQERD